MTDNELITKLRNKQSRDNKELFHTACERIDTLIKENAKYKESLVLAINENLKLRNEIVELNKLNFSENGKKKCDTDAKS